MISIQQYSSLQEAEIVAGMLRSHGIEAEVESNSMNSLFPGSEDSVWLMVPQGKAEEASRLIAKYGD